MLTLLFATLLLSADSSGSELALPATSSIAPTAEKNGWVAEPSPRRRGRPRTRTGRRPASARGAPLLRSEIGAWTLDLEGAGSISLGTTAGLGVRQDTFLASSADLRMEPAAYSRTWRVAADLRASHRETSGADLRESRGSAAIEASWSPLPRKRLAIGAQVGLLGVLRPDWPDLYQPLGGGDHMRTDRFTFWERRSTGTVSGFPFKSHHARLKYEYLLASYEKDPAFDALAEPNHLAPLDHDQHTLRGTWRLSRADWKLGASARLYARRSFFLFARDRGSGATHAGPGGPPPNPLQALRGFEPSLNASIASNALTLAGSYGVEITEDTFQGYYSFVAHRPEIELEAVLPNGIGLRVEIQASWLRYGRGSYAPGPDHPPLTDGTHRRKDARYEALFEARAPLSRSMSVFVRLDGRLRRTNFPPYEPGLFPASREYDIGWSYDNARAVLGIIWPSSGRPPDDG